MTISKIIQDNINDKLIELALKHDVSLSDIIDKYEQRLRFMNKYNAYKNHESKAMIKSYKLVKQCIEHNYKNIEDF